MRSVYRPVLALLLAFAAAGLMVSVHEASAQQATIKRSSIDKANAGTVGVIAGGIGGTYIRIATDLSAVLDDGDDLRILAIAGKGSLQNINDLLYLKGVDVAIVQSDVLTYIRDRKLHRNIASRVHYVTKLYNEEFHLITRKGVRNIAALRGRKVNFGNAGSGTYMTASVVFKSLGLRVTPTTHDYELALQKVKTGEIAGMVYVAGKPASIFSKIKARDGLQILPVQYSAPLQSTYLPARVTAKDYPGLIAPGKPVDTIAVGAVMAVFNWRQGTSRHARVNRFITALFNKFDEFQKPPRHAKWQEVNLNSELPGWTRYRAASGWLGRHSARTTRTSKAQTRKLRAAFKAFLKASRETRALSRNDQDELFQRFMQWRAVTSQ